MFPPIVASTNLIPEMCTASLPPRLEEIKVHATRVGLHSLRARGSGVWCGALVHPTHSVLCGHFIHIQDGVPVQFVLLIRLERCLTPQSFGMECVLPEPFVRSGRT